jgi:hypothetical protein
MVAGCGRHPGNTSAIVTTQENPCLNRAGLLAGDSAGPSSLVSPTIGLMSFVGAWTRRLCSWWRMAGRPVVSVVGRGHQPGWRIGGGPCGSG